VFVRNIISGITEAVVVEDAAGTVARVMRLFDELAKADSEGVLAQVRSAM